MFCDLIRTQYSTTHMRDGDLFPLLVWRKEGSDLFLEELSMNVSFLFILSATSRVHTHSQHHISHNFIYKIVII